MKYAIIIPARHQSSRLPGKPLVNLLGVPMVVRTYRQCLKAAPANHIFVATDNGIIKSVCEQHKINVLMTSSDCLTGTDRVAEAACQVDADTYINVQGDEPVFNPDDITALVRQSEENPEMVINGYCRISDEAQFRSPNTPKVVLRPDGRLLYMSRAAIPTDKSHGLKTAYRQVCAYAFPKAALLAFSSQAVKTPLEKIEDIEILRFLELGWEVKMIPMSSHSVAVDCPEDIEKAEAAIKNLEL